MHLTDLIPEVAAATTGIATVVAATIGAVFSTKAARRSKAAESHAEQAAASAAAADHAVNHRTEGQLRLVEVADDVKVTVYAMAQTLDRLSESDILHHKRAERIEERLELTAKQTTSNARKLEEIDRHVKKCPNE